MPFNDTWADNIAADAVPSDNLADRIDRVANDKHLACAELFDELRTHATHQNTRNVLSTARKLARIEREIKTLHLAAYIVEHS